MEEKESDSATRNTVPASDPSVLIPGDWVYWKNYNYGEVLDKDFFYGKKWLKRKRRIYLNRGENAFVSFPEGLQGELTGRYEGLDIADASADKMRDTLTYWYNNDLDEVINGLRDLGGTYDGLEIVKITPTTASFKITVGDVCRITH